MKDQLNSDPTTDMGSRLRHGASGSGSDGDFGFAFNDSNFSDRLLRIEIMGVPSECHPNGEDCTGISDWDHHRKRRREDIKKEIGLFLILLFIYSVWSA